MGTNDNGWIYFTYQKLPPNTFHHVLDVTGNICVLSSGIINSITQNSIIKILYYRPIETPKEPESFNGCPL